MFVLTRPLAVISLIALSACSASGARSASTSPDMPLASVSPTVAAYESPSTTSLPTATPTEPILVAGGFAEVVTTDLVVRSAPGTGPDSAISGTVDRAQAYVIDGPVDADGYEWWLVVLETYGMLGAPPPGWVAAAGQDGEEWLAPARPSCPEAPSGDATWFEPGMWVACYTGDEMTLGGVMSCSSSPRQAGYPWDHTCWLYRCPTDVPVAACLDVSDPNGLPMHLPSLSGELTRVRVSATGHFDDPAAQDCASTAETVVLSVFVCRGHFVASSYRLVEPL